MNYKNPKFKTNYVQTQNFKFAVHEIGIGPKVFLCIPPFPSPSISYIYSLKHLNEKKHKIIMIDIPGLLGDSIVKNEQFNYQQINQEIEELVELVLSNNQNKSINIIAVSYGASIASEFKEDLSTKFERIYIVSPIISDFLGGMGSLFSQVLNYKWIKYLCGRLIVFRYDSFIKRFFKNAFSPEQLKYLAEYKSKAGYKPIAKNLKFILDLNIQKNLFKFKSKNVYVFYAANEERIYKDQQKKLEKEGVQIKIIKGTHYSFMCEPDLSTTTIIK